MILRQAEELLRAVKGKSLTLGDLHERARRGGSPWSRAQLELFLLCAPGVQYNKVADTFHVAQRDLQSDLQDALLAAVRSFAGRPVPVAIVRSRLPNQFVTTDEQILALVRRTPGLDLFGPNLIRLAP